MVILVGDLTDNLSLVKLTGRVEHNRLHPGDTGSHVHPSVGHKTTRAIGIDVFHLEFPRRGTGRNFPHLDRRGGVYQPDSLSRLQ